MTDLDAHRDVESRNAAQRPRAEAAVQRVRGLAESWATQPNDYDEGTEQQAEDGKAIPRALDGDDDELALHGIPTHAVEPTADFADLVAALRASVEAAKRRREARESGS